MNPGHLFAATHRDNIADAVAKNRTAHGTRNGRAKLTPDNVGEIVLRHQQGETAASLARCFGVHKRTVADILHGKNWRRATAA